MKNSINLYRIKHLLMQQTYSLKSSILTLMAGYLLGNLGFFVGCSYPYWNHSGCADSNACETWGAFLFAFYLIYMSIAFSMTFMGLETSQKRIAFLMLPASNLEKFISRIIIFACVGIIGGFITYAIADGIHLFIDQIVLGHTAYSTIPAFFGRSCNIGIDGQTVDFSGHTAYMITFFILCSAAFRKKPLIKGIGLSAIIYFLCGVTLVKLINYLKDTGYFQYLNSDDYRIDDINMFWWVNIAFWLMALLNIWWSYTIMKKIKAI